MVVRGGDFFSRFDRVAVIVSRGLFGCGLVMMCSM